MAVTPINLNKARKAKQKADSEAQAAANRIAFGRTKAEKIKTKQAAAQAAKALDGHKRDR